MDNFDYIRVDDTGSFVKVRNDTSLSVATKFGIPTKRKLQIFLYWYHDQKQRVIIPAEADFDATATRLAVNEFDAEKAGKELDTMYFNPGKIDMNLQWWQFKDAFLNMAKNLMGVDNNPLSYVIRPDQLAGWVPLNAF